MLIYCRGAGKIELYSYVTSSNCDSGSDKCDLYFKDIRIQNGYYNDVVYASSTWVADNKDRIYFSDYYSYGLHYARTVEFGSSPFAKIYFTVYDYDKSSGDDLLERWDETVWFDWKSVGDSRSFTSRYNNKGTLTFYYWISYCHGHFTGRGCRYCEENYYGGSCNTFCNETANYTCDGYGYKLCEDHYYPDGQCDRYCEAIPDNNICHLAGEICLSS